MMKSIWKVKLNILNILNRKYGIVEKDFLSAELELVPAFKCRSLGFDESLIAGYGQDDKVSVYTSLTAILKYRKPNKNSSLPICWQRRNRKHGKYRNGIKCI